MGSPARLALPATTIFFVLVAIVQTTSCQKVENLVFEQFNQTTVANFIFQNKASVQGALQVTPDSLNQGFALQNQSGRVIYNQKFQLFERSGKLASFSTSFLFNIYRPDNKSVGEGLAFIIAPDSGIPANSYGQYLGLTNSTIDGNFSNHLLAVEFDTVKQDFDPDDNHVGIDINSVRSNATFSASKIGIDLAPTTGPKKYLAWIDYDATARLLSVYLANENETKPNKSILSYPLNTAAVLSQYSYFGFAASTGNEAELNCILKWNLTVEILGVPGMRWTVMVFAIILPSSVAVAAAMCAAAWFVLRRRKAVDDTNITGALKSLPGMPREFSFNELKKATNNFDEKMKLGQGGFGVVYRGALPLEGTEVAVKMFSREAMQGKDDFLAELTTINRLRHKNLVRLIGWCHRKGTLLIVYEFMPNGSLDQHLFESTEQTLSWDRRYKIIAGTASALHYIHNEYDNRVVHRDLKASNIMLDSEFNARLGDFGLARVLDDEKTSYAEADGVPGTMGYVAPECFHTGKATRESDVFGFGAVVLETVCGRRPRSSSTGLLVDYVWTLHREGRILEAVDEKLGDNYDPQDAARLLLLGLACAHPNPNDRPKATAIIQIISRSIDPPTVPPFRPPFIWHMDSTYDCSSVDVTGSSYISGSIGWTPMTLSSQNQLADRASMV
ncbi:putative L-type lectin-domain containing receptor kinase S-5 [Nymphaea thermarum]|nr:putative L-type lectin-domain containing receptor kinase S-5 [Nymphaea thermarum]